VKDKILKICYNDVAQVFNVLVSIKNCHAMHCYSDKKENNIKIMQSIPAITSDVQS